jgi:hypothetical protein
MRKGYMISALCGYVRALGEAGSDDLSTFNAELIRCKIEARHSPIVGDDIRDISLRVSGGDMVLYGSYLRALGEDVGDDLSSFNAETIRSEIEARHGPHIFNGISDSSRACFKNRSVTICSYSNTSAPSGVAMKFPYVSCSR